MTAKLRLQGSALAAALGEPGRELGSRRCVILHRYADDTPGLSVVYHRVEPLTEVVRESAASAEQEFEVAWRGC